MRQLILYIATSLDGKIARSDGSVDWLAQLPNPTHDDYGYADFYARVDTTLQGYTTYRQTLDFEGDFPYPDTTNYVFTRQADKEDTEHVRFIANDIVSFVRQLKEKVGQDIWLIGGGQINTVLLDANLIDTMQIFVMPIVLGSGIPLFAPTAKEAQLTLTETKCYDSGVVELVYQRMNEQ